MTARLGASARSVPIPDASDESMSKELREAELAEVLRAHEGQRLLGYRFVLGFALLGLLGSVTLSWSVSRAPRNAALRFSPADPASFAQGVTALERGDLDAAERMFRVALAAERVPSARLEDYLDRVRIARHETRKR